MAPQELGTCPLDISLTRPLWPEVKVLTSLYLQKPGSSPVAEGGGEEEVGYREQPAWAAVRSFSDLKARLFLARPGPAQPVAPPQGFGSGTQECLQRIYLVAFGSTACLGPDQSLTFHH